MRWNEGGITSWSGAFNILANESFLTLEFAMRCSPSDFTLCPNGNVGTCFVYGSQTKYDGPIAVLLGPTCISTGDRNAYRLKYLYNVRTFGKPTWGTPGWDIDFSSTSWYMRHSTGDAFHTNNPGYYLQRREFPIDFPVWHNPDDVVQSKDAVVEKALWWISNLVYPHNTSTDKTYYTPTEDTVHFSTTIENPNSHPLSARAYFKNLEGVVIDSVNLTKQMLNPDGEQWTADYIPPPSEEFYKIALTVIDETASDHFTVPNATRFTTVGPVVLDSISINKVTDYYSVKPFVKNLSTVTTITSASIKLICDDSWLISIIPASRPLPNIPPGTIVSPTSGFTVRVDSTFTDYFNFKVEISSANWPYWVDSLQVIVGVENEILMPTEFTLEQNFPNPFNPSTTISWQLAAGSDATLNVYDILGRELATLVNEYRPAGKYETEFSAASLPSGVYFYQLKAGEFIQTKKMLLLK